MLWHFASRRECKKLLACQRKATHACRWADAPPEVNMKNFYQPRVQRTGFQPSAQSAILAQVASR